MAVWSTKAGILLQRIVIIGLLGVIVWQRHHLQLFVRRAGDVIISLFVPLQCHCYIDPVIDKRLSERMIRYIIYSVQGVPLLRGYSRQWAQNLRRDHQVIASVLCYIKPDHSLVVRVCARQPLCWLGNSTILTRDGLCLDAACFDREYVADLGMVKVGRDFIDYPAVSRLISQLRPHHWQHYDITYVSPHELILVSRAKPLSYRVIADAESLADQRKWDAIDEVYSHICSQKTLNRKRPKRWDIDVRFAHLVVLRAQAEGE